MKKFIIWILTMFIVTIISFFLITNLVEYDKTNDIAIRVFSFISSMIGLAISFIIIFIKR